MHLGKNSYGKARVRVMKVVRHADHHAMKEWNVQVLLSGEFDTCFETGDNSQILPTDTMKNTVYSLARQSSAETLEAFALELVSYLLSNNKQVTEAAVSIEEKSWSRMSLDGGLHPTTYKLGGPELQTVEVKRTPGDVPLITSGIDGLMILKTTKSAFTGYIKDKLTTLPESTDRLFGTCASVRWEFDQGTIDYANARQTTLAALLSTFAQHDSLSVQHTLYAMGQAVLNAVPAIERIKLTMPNLHCNLADLSRFGQDNPNQIYIPIDEPHGYIEAIIERS